MIKTTAGKAAMSVLKEWNIDHIFGMPGDSINHFMDNLRSEKDEIEFIQVRHEEVGALAASSYAKITGKIGVCLSIGGPGAIHLLNGLYDAKADGAPVLVLAGQVPRAKLGNESFQEVNLERVFDDVSVFNHRVDSPESFPHLLQQAIRTAYAKKGVAVLVIPDDIPSSTIKIDEKTPIANVSKSISHSDPEDVAKALLAIKYAKKPVILAGTGAKHAKLELAQFAEKIAAPVIFTLPGKGILPDRHPYNLGQLGQLGTKPAYEAMEETDLLIMVGTSYPYREFLPDGAEAIQLDSDATQIGRRYPVSIGLVGDSKTTLSQLTHNLDYQENRRFLEECQVNMENWWKHVEKEENEVSTPIKPQQVIPKLQKIVDDDAIVSVDVGNVTVWMARHFRMTNQKFVISSWLATMGCGFPAAIAGKLAHPEKQSVAVCGDGGFTMVMQDFVTAVKYKLPVVVVVLNNSEIGMIKYEQAIQGHLDYQTQLGEMNFAKFAESCGGIGYRVEKYEELETAFEKAALANVPVVIDVVVADEPPLPGKISFGQAANYSKHIMKKFFKEHELEMPPLRKGLSRML
ncbi:pyruvate oxidase [Priestia aryabhattai]|uniref:pyruvate oxidase n=1 Tax=Priestia aryabhattai TaxID=412384 RepID=UPI001C0CCADB|nr:pyruvate oxidase [Priestia aryabhattai]MBU3570671.1 pyruvate oxidase [Priestia aryabhattai]WDL88448.1 pyruvate oxidase [Priestia aryabhattai]